jgi:predicted TIM-barrel fold metal-dependent hydrolase
MGCGSLGDVLAISDSKRYGSFLGCGTCGPIIAATTPFMPSVSSSEIPFCLQVGHTGPLCLSEPGRPIPYLDHVALEFPELKIVAGHIGYPWTEEMIALAAKYPNVHIDTSAYTVPRYPRELVDYMRD